MGSRHTYPLKTLPEPTSRRGRASDSAAAIKAGTAAGIGGVLKDTAPSAVAEDVVRLSRTFALPPELRKGLEEAWEKSLFMGETGIRAREHGGILVRTWPDETIAWRPVAPGMSGEIAIPVALLAGEKLIATGHTHPYGEFDGLDEFDGLHTAASFSDADLAALLMWSDGERMSFVRSGDLVAMVRRTEATERLLDEMAPDAVLFEIRTTWAEAAESLPDSMVAARAHAGTMAVCKRFGLDYFLGEGDTLIREDVSTFRLPP